MTHMTTRALNCMSETLQKDSVRGVMGSMRGVSERNAGSPGKSQLRQLGLIKGCVARQYSWYKMHLCMYYCFGCSRGSLPGTAWHQSHLANCFSTCREASCERC